MRASAIALIIATLSMAHPGRSDAKGGRLRLQVRQLDRQVQRQDVAGEANYQFEMLARLHGSRRALDRVARVTYDFRGEARLGTAKRITQPRNGDRLSGFGE